MVKPIRIERNKSGKILDLGLGLALLRDRRVSIGTKAITLIIGLLIVALAEFLELPVEEILIAVVPMVGLVGDVLFAGVEFILGPILLASWMLPYLVHATLLDQIRRERSGLPPEQPIIDI